MWPKLADVFRKFDLGEAAILPVQLYRHDREKPIERTVGPVTVYQNRAHEN
ncbi:hypothetical protein SAMN05444000_12613 [Shimia gijangensis]|uniref:Uncharacterized protein n=1 Tax=Shimia gijangensis TaxID=1470563 RepID=A0A1M6RPM7_9RHOB|nr:hypothetical protein SAMN05444000_12613 [Shimia gijangensis]